MHTLVYITARIFKGVKELVYAEAHIWSPGGASALA